MKCSSGCRPTTRNSGNSFALRNGVVQRRGRDDRDALRAVPQQAQICQHRERPHHRYFQKELQEVSKCSFPGVPLHVVKDDNTARNFVVQRQSAAYLQPHFQPGILCNYLDTFLVFSMNTISYQGSNFSIEIVDLTKIPTCLSYRWSRSPVSALCDFVPGSHHGAHPAATALLLLLHDELLRPLSRRSRLQQHRFPSIGINIEIVL